MNKPLKFLLSYVGWVVTVFASLFLATVIAGEPFRLTGKLIVACLVGGLFGMLLRKYFCGYSEGR
jgi:hypothetical protein